MTSEKYLTHSRVLLINIDKEVQVSGISVTTSPTRSSLPSLSIVKYKCNMIQVVKYHLLANCSSFIC